MAMTMTTISELQEALDRAVRSIVVRRRGQLAGQYPVASYRQALQDVRSRYVPNLKPALGLCEIEVQDQTAKADLLGFLRASLQDYIHEDRVQTATYAVHGGFSNGFPIENLLTKLLELTVVLGPRKAAVLFVDALTDPACTLQEFTLLGRVKIDEPIQLYDGVRIDILPEDLQAMPSYLPMVHFEQSIESRFRGGALLIVDASVTPRFMNPAEVMSQTTIDPSLPFRCAHQSQDVKVFDATEFCKALSLASKTKAYPSVSWRFLPYDEVANCWGIGGGSSWMYDSSPDRRTAITPVQIHEAKATYELLTSMAPDNRTRLSVPIDRLIESWSGKGYVDRIIDVAIALESLYLPEHDTEMSYRLRNRGARFLESELSQRQMLAAQLKAFYGVRSKAVHTGKIPDRHKVGNRRVKTVELIGMVQELCLRSIRQVIDHGFPDWQKVELG